MRTTLTLEDDLARQLREESRRSGRSFKDVVNDAIRRGLSTGAEPSPRKRKFTVQARSCGFQPGVDLQKLNQLLDEMEIDHAGLVVIRDR
jgi:hypothetical protein